MIRTVITLTALLAAATAAAQTADSFRPRLRAEAIVRGEAVRIGDVVDNAGVVANIPIFRAPDLGESGAVSAASIADAVRAHAIVGLDTAGLSEVTVTRASRAIAAQDVERELARSIAAQYSLGDARQVAVTFDRELRTLHVEPSARADIRIGRIGYDGRSGRFDAIIEPAGGRTLRLTGTAFAAAEAITITRSLSRGEVIKAGDISIERRPKAEVVPDSFGVAEIVVGMTAKQSLRAGQVLRHADLAKPEMVQRDAPVTLHYEVPGIILTVRGKAMEGGAEGDVISVINLQSKRTVQGTITGAGRVVVLANSISAAAPAPQPKAEPARQPSRDMKMSWMLNPVLSNALVSAE